MLRITTSSTSWSTTFKLEGELAGPWVKELEQCWQQALSTAQGQSLRVDLTSVTFIDAAGKALLHAMHQRGAEFIAVGCLTKFIIEEITRREGQPDRTP
jgi:anti-anti-sigma regulatory factor